MNETSSKFLDKLAMEKLINDKLGKVRNSSDNSYFTNIEIAFDDIDEFTLLKADINFVNIQNDVTHYQIPSFCQQAFYIQNNHIDIYAHLSPNPQCNILFIHGLFDDNMGNYNFIIKQLNTLNLNVFFMVLPYHFNRKPDESSFGGEYFFSADLYRTKNAFKQAALDVEAAVQFIGHHNSMPTKLLGYSIGGCVAFQYYLLKRSKIKTFLVNPVVELKTLAWEKPLLQTVGRDLIESNLKEATINQVFFDMDPCEKIGFDFKIDNLAMVYSTYDQVVKKSKYDAFIKKTGIKNAIEYPSGHLNVFRVPRLANDIHGFLSDDFSIDASEELIIF